MAEVAISRHLFGDILQLIGELRPLPTNRKHKAFDYHTLASNQRDACVLNGTNSVNLGIWPRKRAYRTAFVRPISRRYCKKEKVAQSDTKFEGHPGNVG